MKIKLCILLFLLASCSTTNNVEKPIEPKEICITTTDTVIVFITETDTFVINRLKKENHLLRVEIDRLKEEREILNRLLKTKKSVSKLKLELND